MTQVEKTTNLLSLFDFIGKAWIFSGDNNG
jgi:hypothetical protein